ncbi:MAG: ABC transporter permease [Cellulosilyticaceae bacterium]
MMKSYKMLSNRYIRQNKKRTILTLIGIILSLTLISTIGLFAKGTEKSQIEQTKQIEGMSFHIMYETYNEELFNKVVNNPNIERYGIMARGGKMPYNDITFQKYYTNEGANEILKYSIKEGRMPTKANEICIDEWSKAHVDLQLVLGDAITLDEKEYTIVGFLKSSQFTQKSKTSRAITFDNNPKDGQLMIEINSGGNFNETLELLESLSEKENIVKNYALIRLNQMDSNRPLVVVSIIVTILVMASTIIVIYNAFQINVAERMKEFGLLRSIGATKKQIRKIVFREASLLLMITIPMGLIISIGTIYGLQWLLELLLKENNILSIVSIEPWVLIISAIITMITVYVSSILPAYYVGNISPLLAISTRMTIKKELVKKRKNKVLSKYINFKALIAIKNIGRNPKRCHVMILSFVVSATLFITFTTLVQDVIMLKGTVPEYHNIDLEISTNFIEDKNIDNTALVDQVRQMTNIEKLYLQYPAIWGQSEIASDKQVKEAGNIYNQETDSTSHKTFISTQINVYDDTALETAKKYVTSGQINIGEMNNQNGAILVSNGQARDPITKKRYMGKLTHHKVNDEIILTDETNNTHKVKILAIIENNIFQRNTPQNTLSLITTQTVSEHLTQERTDVTQIGVDLIDSSLHLKGYEQINSILQQYPEYSVIDYVDINEMARSSTLLIQILVYGFIFVITLISSINIINTITMNINLRRKELSVLKSIGMSQKDLKEMIMYEGLFYGIVGGFIGCIVGCGFTYVIYDVLGEIVGLAWSIPFDLCVITILVAVVISFLSTLIPMKKIEKDNVIEAIREG